MARGRRLSRTRPEVAGQVPAPHLPLRRCIGCRQAKPKGELLRLAAQDGKAVADEAQRLPGRGAWLCRDAACARAVTKGRQVSRALKGRGSEPSAEQLLEWLDPSLTGRTTRG